MGDSRNSSLIMHLDYEEAVEFYTDYLIESQRSVIKEASLKKLAHQRYQALTDFDLKQRNLYVFGNQANAHYVLTRFRTKKGPAHYNQGDAAGGPFLGDIRSALAANLSPEQGSSLVGQIKNIYIFDKSTPPTEAIDPYKSISIEIDSKNETIQIFSEYFKPSVRTIKKGDENYKTILELYQSKPLTKIADPQKIPQIITTCGFPSTSLQFAYLDDKHQVSGCNIWVSPTDPSVWAISIVRHADDDSLKKRKVTLICSPNFPKPKSKKQPPIDEHKVITSSNHTQITDELSKALGSAEITKELGGLITSDLRLQIPKGITAKLTSTLDLNKPASVEDKKESKDESPLDKRLDFALSELRAVCDDPGSEIHKPFFEYVQKRRKEVSPSAFEKLIALVVEKTRSIDQEPAHKFDALEADKQIGLPRVFQLNYKKAQEWWMRKNLLIPLESAKTPSFKELREQKIYLRKIDHETLQYVVKPRTKNPTDRTVITIKLKVTTNLDDSTPEKLIASAQPLIPDLMQGLRSRGIDLDPPSPVEAGIIQKDIDRSNFSGTLEHSQLSSNSWKKLKRGNYTQGDMEGGSFIQQMLHAANLYEIFTLYERQEIRFGYINKKKELCGFTLISSISNPDQWIIAIIENSNAENLEDRRVTLTCSPFFADLGAPDEIFNPVSLPTPAAVNQLLTEKEIPMEAEICDENFAIKNDAGKKIPTYKLAFLEKLAEESKQNPFLNKIYNHVLKTKDLTPLKIKEIANFIKKITEKNLIQEIANQITSSDTHWDTLQKAFEVYVAIDELKNAAEKCSDKNIGNAAIELIKTLELSHKKSTIDWEGGSDDSEKVLKLVQYITEIVQNPNTSTNDKAYIALMSKNFIPDELITDADQDDTEVSIRYGIEQFIHVLKQSKNTIDEGAIDYSQYPKKIDSLIFPKHINYGDLHGNTIKLLHFLIRRNILILDPDEKKAEAQYKKLYNIYSKINSADTREAKVLIKDFREILNTATINPNASATELRLMGDLLADRGGTYKHIKLILVPTLDEKNYTPDPSIRNAVILTNNNVAYFIIDGKLVQQDDGQYQKITGINRHGLKLLTANEGPKKLSTTSDGPEKSIIAQACEKGGHGPVGNDLLTLLVFEKIGEVPGSILFSNHDAEFFANYWRGPGSPYWPAGQLDDTNANTLFNLGKFIDQGITDAKTVDDLVEKHFISKMKAVDYDHIDDKENPSLTLFMHAPNGLETIAALAKLYQIPFGEEKQLSQIKTNELKTVIDSINQRFREDMLSGRLATRMANEFNSMSEAEQMKIGDGNISDNYPLHRLIWNRGTEAVKQNTIVAPLHLGDGTPLSFVHGHDHTQGKNFLPNMVSLDNNAGKETIRKNMLEEKDFFLQSSGQSAKQPTISPNKMAQLAALKRLNNIDQHILDKTFSSQLENLMSAIEENKFDNDDLPNITVLINHITDRLTQVGPHEEKDTFESLIDPLKHHAIYPTLQSFGGAFTQTRQAFRSAKPQLTAALEVRQPGDVKLDQELKKAAEAIHSIGESTTPIHQALLLFTREQLETERENPNYQFLIGPKLAVWRDDPEPGQFHIRYDKNRNTLIYNVISPIGKVVTGTLTLATMKDNPRLFADLLASRSTKDEDIIKIIAPFIPQIFKITAQRGHTYHNIQQYSADLAEKARHFLNIVRYKEIYNKLMDTYKGKRCEASIKSILDEATKISPKSSFDYEVLKTLLDDIEKNMNGLEVGLSKKTDEYLATRGISFRPLKTAVKKYHEDNQNSIYLEEFEKNKKTLEGLLATDQKSDGFAAADQIYKDKIRALLKSIDTDEIKLSPATKGLYAGLFDQLVQQITGAAQFNYKHYEAVFLEKIRDLSDEYQNRHALRVLTQEVAFQAGRASLNKLVNDKHREPIQIGLGQKLQLLIDEKNRPFITNRTMSAATLLMKKITDTSKVATDILQKETAHLFIQIERDIEFRKNLLQEKKDEPVVAPSPPPSPTSTSIGDTESTSSVTETKLSSTSGPKAKEKYSELFNQFPDLYDVKLEEDNTYTSILDKIDRLRINPTFFNEKIINTICGIFSSDSHGQHLAIIDDALTACESGEKLDQQKATMYAELLKTLVKYTQLPINSTLREAAFKTINAMHERIQNATDGNINSVGILLKRRCNKLNYCFDKMGKKLIAHNPQGRSNVLADARDEVYKQLEAEAARLIKDPRAEKNQFDIIADTLAHADQAVQFGPSKQGMPNPAIDLLYQDAKKLNDGSFAKKAVGAVILILAAVALTAGVLAVAHTGGLSAILGYKLAMLLLPVGLELLGVGAVALPVGFNLYRSGRSVKAPEVLKAPLTVAEVDKKEAAAAQSHPKKK